MKKIIVLFLLSLNLIFLSACTIVEKNEIDFLKEYDAYVYSYRENIHLDGISEVFYELDDIDLRYSFISLVFDCSKVYEYLDQSIIEQLYELLCSNKRIMVLFIDGNDYNFLRDTSFAYGRVDFPRESYIFGFYNFNLTHSITEIKYELSTEEQTSKISNSTLMVFYRRVYNYVRPQ